MNKEEELLQLVKKSAVTIKTMGLELKKLREQLNEPIAIIGMGCRFPGGANSPTEFWELLKKGFDGISLVPEERWDVDAYYDPDPAVPGKMYSNKGGFLNTPIDQFDASFFGISPREAEFMDPQQRLILEVSWEALENAGVNPKGLLDTSTGVFFASCTHDYSDLLMKYGSEEEVNAYMATGNAASVLSGRLSYILGLQGPSATIDTACSSSIVALNVACQSLHSKQCHLAIMGGINLLLNPTLTINFCKANMLSKEGLCKTFDARADGFVRAEGCGVVILKRLSDALKDRDRILALIRAVNVNQDGSSSGLTVPNGDAQVKLIQTALDRSLVKTNEIDYIETHGTGTSLGDPIEVSALNRVFGGKREDPLWLGTVKTNIGHLEGAAGIAGLIKLVLALEHSAIPTHLHLETISPHIDLEAIPAKIPLSLTPWPKSESHPRLAGISAFGFGGTNAHAIVQEAPFREKTPFIDRPLHLLTLSGKTERALDEQLENLIIHLNLHPELPLADIAFTLNAGRAPFEHRLVVTGISTQEIMNKLKTGSFKREKVHAPPLLAFQFSDHGDPTNKTLETQEVFKKAFVRCENVLHLAEGRIFAYQYALLELWKSWGIKPNVVIGEGIGEYAAALAAELISLEEALQLVVTKNLSIQPKLPKFKFISNLTGQPVGTESLQANYWEEILQKPSKYKEGVQFLKEQGYDLINLAPDTNWETLIETLSRLYLKGIPIDWKGFDAPYQREKLPLPTYPFQRERFWAKVLERKPTSVDFNTLIWEETPVVKDKDKNLAKGLSIVFSDNSPIAQALCAHLGTCVIAKSGEWDILKSDKPIQSIYFFGGVNVANVEALSAEELLKLQEISCGAALALVQSLEQRKEFPRLVFVTHSVEKNIVSSPLVGFLRTVHQEYRHIKSVHVDVDAETDFQVLLDESGDEGEVTYREKKRYVPRLIPVKAEPENLAMDSEALYLITGGFGALGLAMAENMIAKGAKHLLLLSRRKGNIQDKLDTWIKKGIDVQTRELDIANESQVEHLLEGIIAAGVPLKGIIHSAGVMDDAILRNQSWDKFVHVFDSKLKGSWNLHKLTQSLRIQLDFFVLFSSLSALMGIPGQSNYAAANSFLDALAVYRRAKGLPALSINWGAWEEFGMATTLDKEAQARRYPGIKSLKTAQACKAFNQSLLMPLAQVMIAPIHPKELLQLSSSWKPLFSKLLPREGPVLAKDELPLLNDRLRNLNPQEKKSYLNQFVQEKVCQVLGLNEIDETKGFFDLGMDSIMDLELKNLLQKEIGADVSLTDTLAFKYPNLMLLSQYIQELLLNKTSATQTPFIIPINPSGTHLPLFCFHPIDGDVYCYLPLAKALGSDYPLYGIQAQGFFDERAFPNTLSELIHEYVRAIRKIQGQGPYHLLGYSAGGIIVSEVAHVLESEGEEIQLLIIIDKSEKQQNAIISQQDPLRFFVDVLNLANKAHIAISSNEYQNSNKDELILLIFDKAKSQNLFTQYMSFEGFKKYIEVKNFIQKILKESVSKDFVAVNNLLIFEGNIDIVETLGYLNKVNNTLPERTELNSNGYIEKTILQSDHFEILNPPHISYIAELMRSYILKTLGVSV